jgi:phosphatidylserine/phosphatidylglycerophosphate/cardiolipin synthase-like enzyme
MIFVRKSGTSGTKAAAEGAAGQDNCRKMGGLGFFRAAVFAAVFLALGFAGKVQSGPSDAKSNGEWLTRLKVSGPLEIFVTPDKEGHHAVIEAIRHAHKIRMTIYHLTDPAVVRSLIEAHARGCDIRLITDGKSLENKRFSKPFEKLVQAGVEAVSSTPAFSITHVKAMVVDDSKAFILSLNLTRMYTKTRDYGIVTTDPEIVGEILKVFDADWTNAKQKTGETPSLNDPNLLWSPVNARSKLRDLIDSARESLSVEVENLGDRGIQAAFVRAAKRRNVSVRIIIPMCGFGDQPVRNFKFLYAMQGEGIQARVMPVPSSPSRPYIHAKMMVVDGKRAYVGSVNFSYNSLSKARELGIVFDAEKPVKELTVDFEADWRSAVPVPEKPPTDCPGTK